MMNILFSRGEHGREFKILTVKYTKYDGDCDKTEVSICLSGIWENKRIETIVLDGHLSINDIVNHILDLDFEQESE